MIYIKIIIIIMIILNLWDNRLVICLINKEIWFKANHFNYNLNKNLIKMINFRKNINLLPIKIRLTVLLLIFRNCKINNRGYLFFLAVLVFIFKKINQKLIKIWNLLHLLWGGCIRLCKYYTIINYILKYFFILVLKILTYIFII